MTGRRELRPVLLTLRARVDAHFEHASRRSPDAFACRPGCEQCCHQRFGVFEVEAAPIREALAELERTRPALRERVRQQADSPAHADRCALLVDGRCAVYEARPIICRTHGLPIATAEAEAEAEDGLHIDHCPLNFRSGPPPRASVLRLAAVNEPLAVLASLWDATGTRVALADLARGQPGTNVPRDLKKES